MESIQYIGEHLLPGKIGHFAVLLSFVSSLLAAIAYFFAVRPSQQANLRSWKAIGRGAFITHGISVFTIIGMIFYLMLQQYYEYNYVWAHVSEDLPFRYIFSAFWEGQEGSFLLWSFWHVILGFVIIRIAGKWEAPVISTLSIIQFFIGSMILGLYLTVGDTEYRIGSSPFILLRDAMDAPIFANADYVSLIKGTGLNPLLQNYWMTIHPPTLFLGFASTSIPFCFAIAGLWTNNFKEMMTAVFPWALFSGAILGTGILMGGAWAYEALSFGGYWAWDPVENMSLVPWIILLAGIHGNTIAKSTGYSIKSTYLFYILTFVFIVYSTFMTRSGVLGDTSVHAFTEMGLETQLLAFLAFFTLLGLVLFFWKIKQIPAPEKEEHIASREFWIFIGSLVLIFSGVLITVSTSLPVYNEIRQLFDPLFEGRVITDPIEHYNKYQLWIGIFIGLLSGFSQYMRFRESNWPNQSRRFWKHLGISVAISAVLTFLGTYWIDAKAWQYILLLFSGIFAVVANLDYFFNFIRGNIKQAGSAFAHIGFGLMVVGVLASGLNKKFISNNVFAQRGLIEGFTEEDMLQNILLFKDMPMLMNEYEVTYVRDTIEGFTRQFTVNYKKKNEAGETIEEFDLHPNVLYSKEFDKIAASNPSTKHYMGKDIFTHISSLPRAQMDPEYAQEVEDSLKYEKYDLAIGDTIFTDKNYLTLESITRQVSHPEYLAEEGDVGIGLRLAIRSLESEEVSYIHPGVVLRGNLLYRFPVEVNKLNLKVQVPEALFDQVYAAEEKYDYKDYTFVEGQSIEVNGASIRFSGFNPQPSHPVYKPQEGDIAVGARMDIQQGDQQFQAEPLYLIRNSQPFNLKDEVLPIGLHFRFIGINPEQKTVSLSIASTGEQPVKFPVEVAGDFRRSDYIVLQAILFPGINFFWLGSCMMMLGLALAMWNRIQQIRRS